MSKIEVAFEGGRGCGKTTTIKSLLDEEDGNVIVNRLPSEKFEELQVFHIDKSNSEPHRKSLEAHSKWKDSFDGNGSPTCPVLAESLAKEKFSYICEQLRTEVPIYSQYLGQNSEWSVLLDRYLDTVVVYGAAEIVISNPEKYSMEDQRRELVTQLWNQVMSINPVFPDVTFYLLSQRKYQESLVRSWETHKNYGREYELDPIEEKTQEIVPQLYQYSYNWKKFNIPDKKDYRVNIDDKSPREVFEIINRLLKNKPLNIDSSRALLKIYGEKYPTSIEDLVIAIRRSSTGSAFPSQEEVQEIGASNCVYNNWALAHYAKMLLGEEVFLVSLEQDVYGDHPVHWMCLQIDENNYKGRVLDANPFNHSEEIGDWSSIKSISGNRVIMEMDLGNIELSIENADTPLSLMQLAYRIETEDFTESLYKDGVELLKVLSNDSSRIFWAIRFRRLLARNEREKEVEDILERLIEYYPSSLVIAREIAKDAISDTIFLNQDRYEYLLSANELLERKSKYIKGEDAKRRFLRYHSWIKQAISGYESKLNISENEGI